MSALLELADECERIVVPSRELDAAIAPVAGLRFVDEGHPLGRCCYDKHGQSVPLPYYTASLDAAMTLVPEGWWIATLGQNHNGLRTTVTLYNNEIAHADCRSAATPALALCAAALRASQEAAK